MNEKIYSLLTAISETERKRFLKKYLQPGIKNERLYKFTKYLYDFLPDGKKFGQSVDPQKMCLLVANPKRCKAGMGRPVQEYNKYLTDDLVAYIRLLKEEQGNFTIEKEISQLAALQEYPSLFDFFVQFANKIEQDIIATDYHDIRYYQQLSSLYQTIYEHPLYNNIRENSGILHKLIDSQNRLYLARALKYRCAEINTIEVSGFKAQSSDHYISTEALQAVILRPEYSNYYYQKLISLLLEGENLIRAKAFLKDLKRNIKKLRRKEADDISGLFSNYCNSYSSASGGLVFVKLVAEVVILRVESGALSLKDKQIKPTTFINVVICGLQVRTIEWVEFFISMTKKKLPSKDKYPILELATCRVYLTKKEYEIAYDTIANLLVTESKYKNHTVGILMRWTLVKCCFHLRETNSTKVDNLEKHLHTFSQWLNVRLERSDLKATRIEGYKNAISKIRTLNQFPMTNKTKKKKLIAEIMQTKRLAGRSWFRELLQ